MKIEEIKDIKIVAGEMHDSEFEEKDFSFSPKEKTFILISYSPEIIGREFQLKFYNVEKYEAVNLDKIRIGKAMGGVFDNIKVEQGGLKLTLVSQDLSIILRLGKLEGEFEIKQKPSF